MITAEQLERFDVNGLYGKLFEACDLNIDMCVVEVISTETFINGAPFNFRGYEYLIQPLNDMYPRQVIIKPAQKGASEAFARKMFILLHRYGTVPHYYEENGQESSVLGIAGIYSFPTDADLEKFSKHRVLTDIVNSSPMLKKAYEASISQAGNQVGVYDSFCYMTGRRSDTGNQSIPAEIIMVDEYDRPLDGDRNILSSLAARVRNARIYGNAYYDGLVINYGTPTLPSSPDDDKGLLIDGLYQQSDQFEWMIRCPRCQKWQLLTYPDSIANFYEKGEKKPKADPYYICSNSRCRKPIDFSQIGLWDRQFPLKYENCEWVAKYPEKTKHGDGIRGYRIPFASSKHTAKKLLMARDIEYKTTADFFNFGLGFAYQDSTIGLTEENFISCTYDGIPWGFYDGRSPHIMGIDQGCYLTVARLKPGSQTETNPRGVWQYVWVEYIKESEAFTKVELNDRREPIVKIGQISKRIEKWHPEVVVMDHLPNTAASEAERELHKEIMWLCDSKGNVGIERIKYEEKEIKDEQEFLVHKITENRNLAIDEYFEQIRGHKWEFPMVVTGDQFDVFKQHHKNLKKIVNQDTKLFTYGTFGKDHYGQAAKLCSEAAEIYSDLKPMTPRSGILVIAGFQSKRA